MFIFDKNQVVHAPQGCDGELLSELLSGYTHGRKYEVMTDMDQGCIAIGKYTASDPGEYEYVLEVTSEGVSISGADYVAAMHGFMSLLESITYDNATKEFQIACTKIYDKPAVQFRSVHICVFPETTLEFLRKCIRTCALVKYSHIVLEFWGMLKFDTLKELSWECAYTKEQIKPIIEEANALGLEIIPMFNHLGHASCSREVYGKHVVLDQNPTYEYLFKQNGWEWDIENEEVRGILRNIRRELMEVCGKGNYFHLGCDEAYSFGKDISRIDILCDYLNELAAELEADGRQGIVWGDMFLYTGNYEGTPYYDYTHCQHKEIADILFEKVSRKLIIGDWQYQAAEDVWKTAEELSNAGFEVLCCPWYRYENAKSAVRSTISQKSRGIMHTTWDNLYEGFHIMVYMGVASWNGKVDAYPDYRQLRFYAADIQRKVLGVKGKYESAGWSDIQVGPGL